MDYLSTQDDRLRTKSYLHEYKSDLCQNNVQSGIQCTRTLAFDMSNNPAINCLHCIQSASVVKLLSYIGGREERDLNWVGGTPNLITT